jgi:hypothetical protein
VSKTRSCPRERDSPDEEDGEDEVRKAGGKVDDVTRRLDALHGDQVYNHPREGQTQQNPPSVEIVTLKTCMKFVLGPPYFIPPISSNDGEMSSVFLYQKYCVSDDIAHSATSSPTSDELPETGIVGQYDQGRVAWKANMPSFMKRARHERRNQIIYKE